MLKDLLQQKPLFVFALESEAAQEFTDADCLFVGIGKINAAYQLAKRIAKDKPSIIVNLGSAGSNHFKRGSVICCTQFIQRDMDVTPLGYEKYQTPFLEQDIIFNYGLKAPHLPEGVCGTGDNFEIGHAIADYNVIDMEGYVLAWVAQQENIPFLCLKYITDGADGNAAEDWTTALQHAAAALKAAIGELKH